MIDAEASAWPRGCVCVSVCVAGHVSVCLCVRACVQVLRDAQVMIERMEHRGGWSCDNDTGDGAGVLTGIPHELYAAELRSAYSVL